eukprot:CAMPEP_0184710084 /NCGR_PEP_ID=MMETSP0314-20130426/1039_1 /TAXON_ID=38298 /ORGANISM="Rhodella maculata, Strain CCMP 736" /LENGTH=221 /DNA_ID=CAMNT_0027171871 /DNA_START=41 /DNA_END=706 /DNA_ORIENTATION=+
MAAFVPAPLTAPRTGLLAATIKTPLRTTLHQPPRPVALKMISSTNASSIPDVAKRNTLNLMLVGAVGAPTLAVLGGYARFFIPFGEGGASGEVVARDVRGGVVVKSKWLDSHQAGDRSLVQGMKGDATYLVVTDDGSDLEFYGLNATCTHLGCVVPWNKAANKFMCPCHGSQYDETGKVVKGPAPLSLALAVRGENAAGEVVLNSWIKEDFRTGFAPWWKA